jgi:FKBP-type peptidyl-prolyl cis-trans isomerase FklB
MKRVFAAIAMSGLGACAWAAQDQPIELKSDTDRISYSLGNQIGSEIKGKASSLNPEILVKAIQDAISGAEPLMSAEDMRTSLAEYKRQMIAQAQAQRQQELARVTEEGKAFLAENAKKEGVVTLPSGLQYKVIEAGTGKSPGSRDKVTVEYRGTLVDGSEFDSSYKRGKPATFPVHGVIPGWMEALQLMKEGAHWEVFIPPELAYGKNGQMAGRTLIFDVKLNSVEEAPPEGGEAAQAPGAAAKPAAATDKPAGK